MACKSCGEKKAPKDNCSFTKAVVEINNPETLTLLRKVVVPSSLGDDETYPASVGKYCNVILAYEANEHVYIYSSDGIPTLISEGTPEIDEIWAAIRAEESARAEADTALGNRITSIESKIPTQASAENQLADKNFVNSSIATNTANFIGTFNSVAELEAYSGPLTNNDYAFVVVTDAAGNTAYDRYKYNADTSEWLFEYELNNSSFTANQWAAINSGITSGDVAKIQTLANIKTIGANLNLDANGELSAVDTTYSNMVGATTSSAGASGLVPAPAAGDNTKFLSGDGTWKTVSQYNLPIASANDLGGIKVGNNLTIDSITGVLDATDTTYTHFTGATSSTDGVQGLVPGPLAGDEDKYLKADGTWATVQTGGNYTAGDGIDISAQDVISATNTGKARVLTTADYNWPTTGTKTAVALWLLPDGMYVGPADSTISVKLSSSVSKNMGRSFPSFVIVKHSEDEQNFNRGMVIYVDATNPKDNSWMTYQVAENGGGGYGSTVFTYIVDRLTSTSTTSALSAKQGKVLKDLIDSLVIKNAGAPTTSTVGTVGMLYEDTTNGKLYQCTAIDTTDPQNPVYTWAEVGGGSPINVVQTTGTSTTDVMSQNAVTEELGLKADISSLATVALTGSYGDLTNTPAVLTTEELNSLWEAA